jgi:cellobiose-specific phosphotransferase system component IIA
VSEQQAALAAQEAERERAEAEVLRTKARMHEAGLADTELIQPEERERFAGTSAVLDNPDRDGVHNYEPRPPLRDR